MLDTRRDSIDRGQASSLNDPRTRGSIGHTSTDQTLIIATFPAREKPTIRRLATNPLKPTRSTCNVQSIRENGEAPAKSIRDGSPVRSPWARLNLWRNPFGELTRDERAELAIIAEDDPSRRQVRSGQALQLIGDCGRGKTTRMLVLRRRWPTSSYVYLDEDQPCPAIPLGDPLLIDEAQRLPRRVARQVFSSGLPLVLATHRDLGRHLRRFGYAVQTIRIGETNTPELVRDLLNRRIEASRMSPGPLPSVSLSQASHLLSRFAGDLRAIEHFLYERVQTQVIRDGEVRFID